MGTVVPDQRGSGRFVCSFWAWLTRGAEVIDGTTHSLRGWQWGMGDGRLRWGQNTVASVTNGGSYWGNLLRASFDASGGVNEAHLAIGDSSGPIFIGDEGVWKLAGIAAAVDGPFNNANAGSGFNAALFDVRGLYAGGTGNWSLVKGSLPVPSAF